MNRTGMMKAWVPRAVRSQLRWGACACLDAVDFVTGRRDPLVPPRTMRPSIGYGDFCAHGDEFARHFIELGGLQPDESVLDVGCGIGRMARPLTKYLGQAARYEGLDIVRDSIEWCRTHISIRHPNFQFTFADVCNASYNPSGKTPAARYRFPYEDASFDFVFLTSVFTHMLPDDMEQYVSEIGRVLRSQGRCLLTFFLLNDESVRLLEAGQSLEQFDCVTGSYRTANARVPEQAVAYDESYVDAVLQRHGLQIQAPVHYGSWCCRERYLSYQDIVIARKRQEPD